MLIPPTRTMPARIARDAPAAVTGIRGKWPTAVVAASSQVHSAETRAPEAPPVAPVREVKDVYFGHEVVDPYRWMETDSAEFSAWMKGQAVSRAEHSTSSR